MVAVNLNEFVSDSVRLFPDHTAIEEPGKGTISYRDLDRLSDRLRDRLDVMGVRPGDRVGICLHKSIEAVGSILAILKAGAAYVPVDPIAPASRSAYILNDCSVKAAITENCFGPALTKEIESIGTAPELIIIDRIEAGTGLARALETPDGGEISPSGVVEAVTGDDLAYILYTSGSTGKPKGVMLSHRNATSFVNWCVETFEPRHEDRFSSHAPLHFDLSI